MIDHTALISELLEHAEWEEQRLNQACADVLRRAAETLKDATPKPGWWLVPTRPTTTIDSTYVPPPGEPSGGV